MTDYDVDETLDVTGKNCPMPVVETKQHIDERAVGEVLEVLATDAGSLNDIAGWAETTAGVELLEQTEADGVYRHYVSRVAE